MTDSLATLSAEVGIQVTPEGIAAARERREREHAAWTPQRRAESLAHARRVVLEETGDRDAHRPAA
ncbi:hypothetical protein JNW90_10730 [Micromonospora sp. STR1s_5]|nr:hypothetical protein [Micromonospora sp. STR1s_5]